MGGRNGKELLSCWVPAELAAAFRAQARASDGGTSAALQRLVAASLGAPVRIAGAGQGAQVGIRLKGAERERLAEVAKQRGTTPSNWIRSLAIVHLGRMPQWTSAELEALREVFKELRRIGVNINQIAHVLNGAALSGKYPPYQGTAAREAAELIRTEARRVVAVMTGNFDYWGLPDAERPTAAPGAMERADAAAVAAEERRARKPRRRPARFVDE